MKAYLYDDTPAAAGEKHGPLGPTHRGTLTVDYEYQVEEWVVDLERSEPKVVCIECPDLCREWWRDECGKFVEFHG